MSGSALIIGVTVMLGLLLVVAVIAVLLARRRSASGPAGNRDMPPPVDPGYSEPEEARDLNAEK
jgi:hypothetical protein